MRMLDSIVPANLPPGADAYAGYVDGRWPTFHSLAALFPHAHLLSIAVFPANDAECLDIETGDATPAQAPAWTRRQHQRGIKRPVLYANAATMGAVRAQMRAAGIPRDAFRLLSAHYNGQPHICSVHSCGYPGVPAVDGTQWRDNAPGNHGSQVDESLLADDFFGHPAPSPRPHATAESEVQPMLINKGKGATTPVALPDGASRLRLFANHNAKVKVDLRHEGSGSRALDLGYASAEVVTVPEGVHAVVVHRLDDGEGDVSCVVTG